MDAPPHHRKIDLQSPSDLTHLISTIKASAREKLDRDIPKTTSSSDGGTKGEAKETGRADGFREKVGALVGEYIQQTLTLALPSISINGFDAPPPTSILPQEGAASPTHPHLPSNSLDADSSQIYEPYDPRLALRLRDLYAKLESESTKLAELRRHAPADAALLYSRTLSGELEAEREQMEALGKGEVGDGRREGDGHVMLVGEELRERIEDVRGSWEGAMVGLGALEGVGGVRERVERAGVVAGVVEG